MGGGGCCLRLLCQCVCRETWRMVGEGQRGGAWYETLCVSFLAVCGGSGNGGWLETYGDAKRLRRKEDATFGDGRCCVCRIEILCERVGRNIIML